MPRRRRSRNAWFQHHALPFLSIMLGLIAVMAITGMGLASIKRMDDSQRRLVKLANVPPQLIPFHIICEEYRILWKKNDEWKEMYLEPDMVKSGDRSVFEFVNEVANLAEDNRRLSFSGKQNTVILWVRPKGIITSAAIELHLARLPLRIGKLPLLENEDVALDEVEE